MSGIDYELKTNAADEMVDLYGDFEEEEQQPEVPVVKQQLEAPIVSKQQQHSSQSYNVTTPAPTAPTPAPAAYSHPSRKIYNDDG